MSERRKISILKMSEPDFIPTQYETRGIAGPGTTPITAQQFGEGPRNQLCWSPGGYCYSVLNVLYIYLCLNAAIYNKCALIYPDDYIVIYIVECDHYY